MKILITGGASGLGKAITCFLAKEKGNTVYFTYYSSVDEAKEIERNFDNTKAFQVDFRNEKSLKNFIEIMTDIAPEVLINNALTGYYQNHFHKLGTEVFTKSFEFNVLPVLIITQKFISVRRKLTGGKIITILSSFLIGKPPLGFSEYAANKAYLQSMAKSWANENSSFGITSNCISPSFMQTNLTASTDSRVIENMINENPNKRLLNEDEVASVVAFLVSTTPQINGHNIVINAAKDLI